MEENGGEEATWSYAQTELAWAQQQARKHRPSGRSEEGLAQELRRAGVAAARRQCRRSAADQPKASPPGCAMPHRGGADKPKADSRIPKGRWREPVQGSRVLTDCRTRATQAHVPTCQRVALKRFPLPACACQLSACDRTWGRRTYCANFIRLGVQPNGQHDIRPVS
jgi:hypothetical protein